MRTQPGMGTERAAAFELQRFAPHQVTEGATGSSTLELLAAKLRLPCARMGWDDACEAFGRSGS